jgi:flavin reductase (DIM6/NTAB) family NADH-FMN oxidoreductase RutF
MRVINDPSLFDQLVGELNYPMYIVTTSVDGTNAGCLVGFTSQVSIDPPRFLVCLSEKNRTTALAAAASHLAVHLIRNDDPVLPNLFGEQTGDQIDKFARCRWAAGPHAVPVLVDAAAWFIGRIEQRFNFGDHIGHLLEPEEVSFRPPLGPTLSFADVRDMDPGHDA